MELIIMVFTTLWINLPWPFKCDRENFFIVCDWVDTAVPIPI